MTDWRKNLQRILSVIFGCWMLFRVTQYISDGYIRSRAKYTGIVSTTYEKDSPFTFWGETAFTGCIGIVIATLPFSETYLKNRRDLKRAAKASQRKKPSHLP